MRVIRVGTDCSGIEAPIVALRQLRIPFTHEFSSEIDKHCIATIRANFQPKIIFGDIKARDIRDVPDIDLYVCGFPCQPFSTAGKRLGERDPRGTIFYECLRVIRYKNPMIFILENVRGILSIDGGETFRTILDSLDRLKIYDVHWKVLNTADYGIPQSRKRVFIVGIRRDRQKKPFEWPEPIPCRPLEEFVDWDDASRHNPPDFHYSDSKFNRRSIFINTSFRENAHKEAHRLCPCLTTNCHKMYCIKLGRRMNTREIMRLQGFDPEKFNRVVSRSYSCSQFGNTISVNVLQSILLKIFGETIV